MFFQTIYGLLTESTEVGINIKRVNDKLTVAVMPRHRELKERTADAFIPLVVSGTPEELDCGFADIMAAPVARSVGIMTNLREFERQAERAAAKAKPKTAAEKETKEAKETKEKNDRLDKLMKRVDESVTARRFADAMALRPGGKAGNGESKDAGGKEKVGGRQPVRPTAVTGSPTGKADTTTTAYADCRTYADRRTATHPATACHARRDATCPNRDNAAKTCTACTATAGLRPGATRRGPIRKSARIRS